MSEAVTPAEKSIAAGDNRKFFGHPMGLGSLFGVEMMERFSFYGMKAILLFFLYYTIDEGGLGLAKDTAVVIYATYGAAVYLLSIVGGWAADRLWGPRKSTLYGGIVIMLGHISMALPMNVMAWVGLILIALGTGFLKPNISTMVGQLYTEDDPRRDAGFEIFYMSINIGAGVAPFAVAAMRSSYGFHGGFLLAAIGMAISLVVYVLGTRTLHGAGDPVPNPLTDQERSRLPLMILGVLVAVAAVFGLTLLWNGTDSDGIAAGINDVVFIIAVGASIYYFIAMFRHPKTTETDRKHLMAYIPLFVGAALFFMVFEQAGGYMALFADTRTNLNLFGMETSAEWFQSVNPITIVLLAPLFAWLFTRRAGRFPSTPTKFAISVLLIGISALIMSWLFQIFPEGGAKAAFWVLASIFVMQTVAELFLSPVGLSATTTLAPKHFASQVMGLWFLTSAVGQSLAGQVIKIVPEGSPTQSYLIYGIMTLVIAAILFALVPWTRRQMQDIEDQRREAFDRHQAEKKGKAANAQLTER